MVLGIVMLFRVIQGCPKLPKDTLEVDPAHEVLEHYKLQEMPTQNRVEVREANLVELFSSKICHPKNNNGVLSKEGFRPKCGVMLALD